MAKRYHLIAVGAVKVDGRYKSPGEAFDVATKKEVERLVGLGAARLSDSALGSNVAPSSKADPDAKLLAAIEAAETLDALAELMPADQPSEAVVEAFQRRGAALEN